LHIKYKGIQYQIDDKTFAFFTFEDPVSGTAITGIDIDTTRVNLKKRREAFHVLCPYQCLADQDFICPYRYDEVKCLAPLTIVCRYQAEVTTK
jgi:hypothetical protein